MLATRARVAMLCPESLFAFPCVPSSLPCCNLLLYFCHAGRLTRKYSWGYVLLGRLLFSMYSACSYRAGLAFFRRVTTSSFAPNFHDRSVLALFMPWLLSVRACRSYGPKPKDKGWSWSPSSTSLSRGRSLSTGRTRSARPNTTRSTRDCWGPSTIPTAGPAWRSTRKERTLGTCLRDNPGSKRGVRNRLLSRRLLATTRKYRCRFSGVLPRGCRPCGVQEPKSTHKTSQR